MLQNLEDDVITTPNQKQPLLLSANHFHSSRDRSSLELKNSVIIIVRTKIIIIIHQQFSPVVNCLPRRPILRNERFLPYLVREWRLSNECF